ncbi:RNA pyrophosphohydrolase [Kangiella japonica]|uniref:RNA pyrophosphohydrolase n=1 Tax=Kangiella japonica TaxID=647384 RepID=A0ABN0SZ19_9GAMM
MIDADGFRANVGIIICNKQGQLLWTRRFGQTSWQFPQGGVHPGESAEQTMYRELYEEVGLEKDDVRILGSTQHWYKYRLPQRLIRQNSQPLCVGQKQKWFLLQLVSDESKIDFAATDHPEFDGFIWVNYWYPVRNVVNFKRDVYRSALSELMGSMFRFQMQGKSSHRPEKKQKKHNPTRHAKQSKSEQHTSNDSNGNQQRQGNRRRRPRHPYRSNNPNKESESS